MLLKTFLISLFVSVALALSDKCEEGRELCRSHDDASLTVMTTIPETAEQLDAYCEYVIKYFECLLEAQSECNDETDDRLKTLPVLKHMCNKETNLYKNLLSVLPCVKHEIALKRPYKCHAMSADVQTLEKFEKILHSVGITDVGRDDDCFHKYFYNACSIGSNGALCGTMARDVGLEISELNIEAKGDECSVKFKGKLSYMAPEMEILYLESEDSLEETEEDAIEE